MKNKKFKSLIALIFAFSLALGGATLFAEAKAKEPAQIVLAEDENEGDDEETPTTSEEETPSESEETPSTTPSEPAQESSQEAKSQPAPVDAVSILKIFAKAFRDAIKDLIEHFKRWFKL